MKLKTPWLSSGEPERPAVVVEYRKLAPRAPRPKPGPKPKRAVTRPRKPIEGGPKMRSGSWDWHQRDDG
jgi:hypothetical protein